MITGIVVALPDELTTLTAKRVQKKHCLFISDTLLVAYSGTGPANARQAAELLIHKGATQLISWGCAAALSPQLKPGDLALVDTLIDVDNYELSVDKDWHRHAKRLLAKHVTLYCGCLAESTGIVSSKAEKEQLRSFTDAIALDMESVAIAKVAEQHHLPFLAIRSIVDPVSMNLPRAISFAANAEGDIVLARLLLFLALHPLELPQLIKLGLHFSAAKKTLTLIAKHLHDLVAIPKSATTSSTSH
ncbi:purine phosphorylase [Methylosoma difficile]